MAKKKGGARALAKVSWDEQRIEWSHVSINLGVQFLLMIP